MRIADPATLAEQRDMIAHLQENGMKNLLRVLGDTRVYTHGGRPVLSRIARRMRTSQPRAAALMTSARELITAEAA